MYPKFVSMPNNAEELMEIHAAYSLLGLPGAVGSMDVVHIPWCMCPASLANLCTGKEGYPTLAYNVIVDHSGRALSSTAGTYGSRNDKTIVRFDESVEQLRTKELFTGLEYQIFTGPGPGDVEMLQGAHVINDGGYHEWEVTQAASRLCTNPGYKEWREQMESVRKDVECFFGRLKARFRILKMPISFHKKVNVDDLFFTCVALQNMLLEWDKEAGSLTSWDVDVAWEDPESSDDADARLWCLPRVRRARRVHDFFTPQPTDDFSGFGKASMPIDDKGELVLRALGDSSTPAPGEMARYHAKQAKLVQHFSAAWERRQVTWLRTAESEDA